ncbi:hypothetical protein quinque_016097 [Culex quinquefasciatus]
MGWKEVFLCALVVSVVVSENPIWRKLEGDLEPEAEAEVAPFQEVDESYRLPTVTAPTHYNLHLRTAIHRNERTFQGTVEIFLNVLQATDKITILNRDLVIRRVTLYRDGAEPELLETPPFDTDPRTEHLTITSSQQLAVGSYMIRVEFDGRLQENNNMGFFRSSYLDNNGNRRYLASSKFEPTHARSAFPCYDEPRLKATFTLSITHGKDYHAVANMPQEGELEPDQDDADFVTTHFQKSTRMSTYLLAFAVSDFAIRTSGYQTVYARSNVFEETEYPLQAGVDILNALSAYTRVEYTDHMPKMTQIAIPDRGTGAMENWGLVAYGEPVLLFNPSVNTYRNKKTVDTIIAHEYAHQWFGNLVSPDWWDYIWLNEGFATVYEYLAAQLAYPEKRYMDLWNVEVIHNAFAADARESIRPMTWNAASPSEIAALFDTIAYSKAGSVLNMFRVVFQDENWRAGLLEYFNQRLLDAAVADHLYDGLQLAIQGKDVYPTGFTVKQLMDSWTTAPGFPLLTVKRDYKNGQIYLSQERFLSDRQLPNSHVFHIPYNFATQTSADFDNLHFDWLSSKAAKISTEAAENEWVIFNKQQTGYYRVNYDPQNWELLIDALMADPSVIHVQNRAQLINDAYNLARADRLDMSLPLTLMKYLAQETAYPPWAAANTVLTYLNNKLRGTEHYPAFLNYVHSMLDTVYATVTVDTVQDGETMLDKYLRQSITTWACRIGTTDCLTRTEAALKQAVQSNIPVHPDVSSVVYCYGLHNSGETEFVWLYNRLHTSKNQAERSLLIDSLGCSQNKEYLKAYLMSAFGTNNLLSTERTRIVSAVYSTSRAGVDAMIEFLMDETIVDEFISSLGVGTLNNAIANIAARTNNAAEQQQLEDLLGKLGSRVSASTAAAARATVASNFYWFNTLEGLIVGEFLEGFVEA